MDPITAVLVTFGAILIFAGWIQLLITSFSEDYAWGLSTLFLPALSYVYSFFAWKKAQDAMVLTFIGWALVIVGLI